MELTEKVHAWGPVKLLVMSPDEFNYLKLLMKAIESTYEKDKDLVVDIIGELFPNYDNEPYESTQIIVKECKKLVRVWREFEKIIGANQ